jgi:glycine oxidase
VLLTPVTGEVMAQVLTTGTLPDHARRFAADRAHGGGRGHGHTTTPEEQWN